MASGKLAYFFEAHDLVHVFADWPEEIGLVLCLEEAGNCELLLYHLSERGRMPAKAAAVLDCARSELEVVPEVEGYPTRRVLFTDEQKLMALILDEDDLAELAQDYLINHRYEASRKQEDARKRQAPTPEPEPKPQPRASAFSDVFRWKPRLHLSESLPSSMLKPTLPEGFVALDETAECDFAEGILEVNPNGVRLSIAPEEVSIHTPVRRARQIGFRDDFSCFVLPRYVAAGWEPGKSLVIDMPEEHFPRALRARYAQGPRQTQVTITAQGVFISPGALVPTPEPEAAAPVRRRRLFSPVRSALIAMVCLGLVAGAMLREDGPLSLPFLELQWGRLMAPEEPGETRLALR
ncbi:hypothetical protein [Marinovum sp.]|uniref:hypothetical protein n=1 Tax=Marinovum sp. TaxID=2024839 RepID=UPI002B26908E|nr:hypothetical protein [Marinovum sp.]